jgi:hypothetical protein
MQGQEREELEVISSSYECKEASGRENSSLGLLRDTEATPLCVRGQGCHFVSCATVVASVTVARDAANEPRRQARQSKQQVALADACSGTRTMLGEGRGTPRLVVYTTSVLEASQYPTRNV